MKFTIFTILKHSMKCFPEHSQYLISEFFFHIVSLNPTNNTMKQVFCLHLTDEEMESQRPDVTKISKV